MTVSDFSRDFGALDLIGPCHVGRNSKLKIRDINPSNACLRKYARGNICLSDMAPPGEYYGQPIGRLALWANKARECFEKWSASVHLKNLNAQDALVKFGAARLADLPRHLSSTTTARGTFPLAMITSKPSGHIVDAQVIRFAQAKRRMRKAADEVILTLQAYAHVPVWVFIFCSVLVLGMATQKRSQLTDWKALSLAWDGTIDTQTQNRSASPTSNLNTPVQQQATAQDLANALLLLSKVTVSANAQPTTYIPALIPPPLLEVRNPANLNLMSSTPATPKFKEPRSPEHVQPEPSEMDTFAFKRKAKTEPEKADKRGADEQQNSDWAVSFAPRVQGTQAKPIEQKSKVALSSTNAKINSPDTPNWRAVATNDGALVVSIKTNDVASFQQVRPGQSLPNGEVLRGVRPDEGYSTDAGSFNFANGTSK